MGLLQRNKVHRLGEDELYGPPLAALNITLLKKSESYITLPGYQKFLHPLGHRSDAIVEG